MYENKMSYRGKKVYVGIDVHKKSYSVTAIYRGEIIRRDTMNASAEGLCTYLKNRYSGAQIQAVYEAGFSGFVLHRDLVKSGVHNIVINPASIKVAANDRVKTDRRDSRKLAEQLSKNDLHGIYVPTEQEETQRVLTRTREQIVCSRARVAHQIKSKLHYFGMIKAEDETVVSKSYLEKVLTWEMTPELKMGLTYLVEQWHLLERQLKEIFQKIKEQAKADPFLEKIYRSVPGVGPIIARTFSNELGNLSERFKTEKSLFQFTGLTPSENSSGETVKRGHISRQGSSRLRYYLTEAAWSAIAVDDALKEAFDRIAKTRGKKRAIVAIARKLVGRIRACFRYNQTYQLGVYAA